MDPVPTVTKAHFATRISFDAFIFIVPCNLRHPQACRPEFEQLLHRPYTELAALLGCEESSIGIVSSATAAWQRIFLGLPLWLPGSRIYTSVAEYGSNFLAYLQVCPPAFAPALVPLDCAARVRPSTGQTSLGDKPVPLGTSCQHRLTALLLCMSIVNLQRLQTRSSFT